MKNKSDSKYCTSEVEKLYVAGEIIQVIDNAMPGSVVLRLTMFYTEFAFYLSIIDEDGPDDLVLDVLLFESKFDDDLVFPSGVKVLPLSSSSR